MRRAFYDAKPKALEAVGNGDYFFRWDIREEEIRTEETDKTQYSCEEVIVHGHPDYEKCVEAIIRSEYTSGKEVSLVNQYNSYHHGITDNPECIAEYRKFLSFVKMAESISRSMFPVEEGHPAPDCTRLSDVISLLTMTVNTMNLSSSQSLKVKTVFPQWKAGIYVKKGEKYQYNGKLYEVVQDHTTQSNWSPENQSSLWVEVVEDHEGTLEDPIPYNEELNPIWQGMILEEGKYYTQSGVVYKCIRNTGNKVTHNLADLVSGGFVQKV